jgi:hypothetical protein
VVLTRRRAAGGSTLFRQGLERDGPPPAGSRNRQAQRALGADEQPGRHGIHHAEFAQARAQQRVDADQRQHEQAKVQ